MNREIKFRGKDLESGEWQSGYYRRIGENQHYINRDIFEFAVDPESVGQFTGLQDVDGTDIYEGDILSIPTLYETPEMTIAEYDNWEVVFMYGAFHLSKPGFVLGLDTDNLYIEAMNYDERFRIIGNIHENPELLK